MATQVQLVKDFIDKAVRNYKYTSETGTALKRALQLFEDVLQDDEVASLELIKSRADVIANRIDVKAPNKYSASSLMVYKSRVLRAINDYVIYGMDAKQMSAWSPKSTKRPAKTIHQKAENLGNSSDRHVMEAEDVPRSQIINMPFIPSGNSSGYGSKVSTLELPLKDDRNIIVYYPSDLSAFEAEKIGQVLKSIALLNEG
jgi:hypothetical protein